MYLDPYIQLENSQHHFIASFFLKFRKSSCFWVFINIYETCGEFEALASQWQAELFSQNSTFIINSSLQCETTAIPSTNCPLLAVLFTVAQVLVLPVRSMYIVFLSLTYFPSEINSSEIITCLVFSELLGSWFFIFHFPVFTVLRQEVHDQGLGQRQRCSFGKENEKRKDEPEATVLEDFHSPAKPF